MKTLGTLMRKLLAVGVTTGPTFHLEIDPGVGLLIVPNARLTATNLNVVTLAPEPRGNPKAHGFWKAKPIHVGDKHLGV